MCPKGEESVIEIFIYYYIIFWAFIFGCCIGSFLNVVVYRLPKNNFFDNSRSYCPRCKAQLKWQDLIPVFSYIFLKARCRYCKGKISIRYPLVEFASGLFAVACFIRFNLSYAAILTFIISIILFAISLIDIDTMEIPNSLIIALIPIGILWALIFPEITILQRIIGFFVISTPLLIITLIIPNAFGGGDIKLMAVCGFLLSWHGTLLAFFIALLLGGSYASYLLITQKKQRGTHIAFGPYLCVGVMISIFFSAEIIGCYLNLFI